MTNLIQEIQDRDREIERRIDYERWDLLPERGFTCLQWIAQDVRASPDQYIFLVVPSVGEFFKQSHREFRQVLQSVGVGIIQSGCFVFRCMDCRGSKIIYIIPEEESSYGFKKFDAKNIPYTIVTTIPRLQP